MQHLIRYAQRKRKFILIIAILLALNYWAWSFLWKEQLPQHEEQAEIIPSDFT